MTGAKKNVKEEFDIQAVYITMLELGEKHLKKGGRLVYLWHGDERTGNIESPSHPSFDLIGISGEVLTKKRKRYLITLQKK